MAVARGRRLAGGAEAKLLVVLTTVNALVQRVPPRKLFDGRVLALGPGGRVPLDRLQSFFRNNGYIRTDTVREPGEFAVRGGIVDLFPAGAAQPIRLDFFGDTLESLRSFDPLTQRSTGTLEVNTAGTLSVTNALAIGANTVKLDGAGSTLTDTATNTIAGGTISGLGTLTANTNITGSGTIGISMSDATGSSNQSRRAASTARNTLRVRSRS